MHLFIYTFEKYVNQLETKKVSPNISPKLSSITCSCVQNTAADVASAADPFNIVIKGLSQFVKCKRKV